MNPKIAYFFSFAFQPFLTPIYAIIMLMNMWYSKLLFDTTTRVGIILAVILFTLLIPFLGTLILAKLGLVSDYYLKDRKERTGPYIITFLSYLLCIRFFIWIGIDSWVIFIAAGTTLAIMIIAIVNLFWKISAHMSGMGGLCGSIFAAAFVFHSNPIGLFIIVILLSGLVAWSRLKLKAHTSGQVLAGFCVGFLGAFLPILFL